MKQKRTVLNIVSFLPLAGALGYIIYMITAHKEVNWVYRAVIGAALLCLWVLRDVVIPKVTGEFEGKTKEQMDAYVKMAGLELLGYAGLGWFAVSSDQNSSIYGAVVFAGATMFKRNFRDIYYGIEGAPAIDAAAPEETGEDTAAKKQEKAPEAPLPSSDRNAEDDNN